MRELQSLNPGQLYVREAIQLARQGVPEAFDLVYREYRGFARAVCLRMLRDRVEAEDGAQEVFVHVLRKIHTFRSESAFSTWLYRLTTNTVLTRLRKKKHDWNAIESRHGENNSSDYIGVQDPHLNGLLCGIDIQRALDSLPDGYRTVFILHDVQGYDHREISGILGRSIGNSKSQLHKARKRLRQLLADKPRQEAPEGAIPE
jgi:RNA polymerase sigma-70 factor, ECF subfamily